MVVKMLISSSIIALSLSPSLSLVFSLSKLSLSLYLYLSLSFSPSLPSLPDTLWITIDTVQPLLATQVNTDKENVQMEDRQRGSGRAHGNWCQIGQTKGRDNYMYGRKNRWRWTDKILLQVSGSNESSAMMDIVYRQTKASHAHAHTHAHTHTHTHTSSTNHTFLHTGIQY